MVFWAFRAQVKLGNHRNPYKTNTFNMTGGHIKNLCFPCVLDGFAAAMPGFAWAAPAVLGSRDGSNMPPCPPRGRPLSRPRRGLTCKCAIVERLDSIGNPCIF